MEQKLKSLREYSEWAGRPPVLEDAADEIERLRGLLAAERERCAQSLVDEATRFADTPIQTCATIGEWSALQRTSGEWLKAAVFLRADAP